MTIPYRVVFEFCSDCGREFPEGEVSEDEDEVMRCAACSVKWQQAVIASWNKVSRSFLRIDEGTEPSGRRRGGRMPPHLTCPDPECRTPDNQLTITIDPNIRGGEPCFAGTRIDADMPARCLLDGVTPAGIIALYPSLTMAHVDLSIWYVARFGTKKQRKRVKKWMKESRA